MSGRCMVKYETYKGIWCKKKNSSWVSGEKIVKYNSCILKQEKHFLLLCNSFLSEVFNLFQNDGSTKELVIFFSLLE